MKTKPYEDQHPNKVLKHKRRFCREGGCDRIVKSQGLCQRHGAKPKKCRILGCPKQAQGSFKGMCSKWIWASTLSTKILHRPTHHRPPSFLSFEKESHFRIERNVHDTTDSPTGQRSTVQFCRPVVSSDEDIVPLPLEHCNSTSSCATERILSSCTALWDRSETSLSDSFAQTITNLQISSEKGERLGYEKTIPSSHGNAGVGSRTVRWDTTETIARSNEKPRENQKSCYFQFQNDNLLRRPSTVSMRAFSTDTQFSFDVTSIDQDVDFEHTFDVTVTTSDSAKLADVDHRSSDPHVPVGMN
jgi:hypothetical protein